MENILLIAQEKTLHNSVTINLENFIENCWKVKYCILPVYKLYSTLLALRLSFQDFMESK